MKKGLYYIKRPKKLFMRLCQKGIIPLWDKEYLKIRYKEQTGKKLNINNPVLYNEKLQWLKLYDRKPIYTDMVDKYEAKSFIKKTVGDRYVIKTIGIYDKFDDINFDSLPKKFVMKCTHNSGGVIICSDKSELDIDATRESINEFLKVNHYLRGREWPYKNVKPRIIIEELLENNDGSETIEYNFFCFDGKPKIVMTCHGDKRIKRYNDFYDIDFHKINLKCNYDNSDIIDKKPHNYDEMLKISRKLSQNIPHLRVDLYLCNNKIYVGELTFFHWSGFGKFTPGEWDKKLGDMIKLPKKINK